MQKSGVFFECLEIIAVFTGKVSNLIFDILGLQSVEGIFNSWEILSLFAISLTDYEITEDYRKLFIRMSVNVNCIHWEEIYWMEAAML